MSKSSSHHYHSSPLLLLLLLVTIFLSFRNSEQLQSSQSHSLLRIKRLLNFPAILKPWKNNTDYCNSEPTTSLAVVCYQHTITQLHIIGHPGASLLHHNFSIDSFFKALVKLPDLKVLTLVSLGLWGRLPGNISCLSSLEILNMSSNFLYGRIPQEMSSMTTLRTLILDDNMLADSVPNWLSSLPALTVLSLNKNSFNGTLPTSLSYLENLRVLALSHNHFYGEVPDLSRLKNLQLLVLEGNALGPKFPFLGNKLVTLVLSKNRFRSSIPSEVESYSQLERFDIAFNSFVGPFPQSLLSLPSIAYINIAGNKLTGMFISNQSCNPELKFVDLSSNLLTGNIPDCLVSHSKGRVVLYSNNCLSSSIQSQSQLPSQSCRTEALAVGIRPEKKSQRRVSKAVLASGIIGSLLGITAVSVLSFLLYTRLTSKAGDKATTTRSITETVSTETGYTSKLLCDARYISQSMESGALGLPGYRSFSLEELEEATNNFDTSAFMGEGSHGQMYRGLLKDGSCVAIKCLKLKRRSYETQNFTHHIERISKLRHPNIVSATGHCFEYYLDDSSVSRVFLVFEYVPNGTLGNWISEGKMNRTLSWTKRISTAIGIAKGVQFLHTGVVPSVYRNGLKISDVLMDQSFIPKISSYNIPLFFNKASKVNHGVSFRDPVGMDASSEMKIHMYEFGVILLEIIKGIPVKSEKQVDALIDQIQVAISGDRVARRRTVDPLVNRTCLDESLKTMMEVCRRCLLKDPNERPSLEDVLWNLQYAAQVQDASRLGEPPSSEGSSPA